jgi:hypothetical protein
MVYIGSILSEVSGMGWGLGTNPLWMMAGKRNLLTQGRELKFLEEWFG